MQFTMKKTAFLLWEKGRIIKYQDNYHKAFKLFLFFLQ